MSTGYVMPTRGEHERKYLYRNTTRCSSSYPPRWSKATHSKLVGVSSKFGRLKDCSLSQLHKHDLVTGHLLVRGHGDQLRARTGAQMLGKAPFSLLCCPC